MINTKRPGTDDYTQVGFLEAKDGQGNYQNIDHIYDSEGNIVFQQGYLNEYDGADDFSIPAIGKPLIDYIIYGNTFQDGVPTPDNPIMPEGTGERTENLVFVSVDNEIHYSNYNQYTISDGTITVTGRMLIGFKVKVASDTTYTVSAVYKPGVLMRIREYTEISNDWTNGFIGQPVNTNLPSTTFTTSSETEYILVTFYSEIVGMTINNIMLNLGSEALSYEPYGYKIPIMAGKYEFLEEPLRAVKTYKDTIDLDTKLLTRQIKELVLTGEENWRLNNRVGSVGGQYFNLPIFTQERTEFGRMLCSHYTVANPYDRLTTCCALANYSQGIDVRINNPSTDGNIDAFKSYLTSQYTAGTPVTVWYVLAEPTTETMSIPSGLTGIIEGVGIQDGTPTPDKPIMPVGKGERTRQIIEYPYFNKSSTMSGIQWTISENGHIKGIGTTTGGTNFFFNRNVLFKAGTYTIKIYGKHRGMALRIYDSEKRTSIAIITSSDTDSFTTFTLDSDTSNKCDVYFNTGYAEQDVYIDCDIMFNTGSTALPYEPYGYKIPISSANTTTPIYLGEVETTRKVKKLVLTGEERLLDEGLSADFYRYRVYLTQLCDANTDDVLSSHYSTTKETKPNFEAIAKPLTVSQFVRFYTLIPSLDDFKAYLAAQYATGTPVCVWYVLANAETAVVNEPLMRIGDYADSVDFSQAGVQIPTLKRPNTTVIDITTSLPPSEVYAKYRGSKTQKYDLFLAANGDSFEAKNGQSLYIGDDT